MPRFAANLHWLFTEHPFLERFAAARSAGFTAVEFPNPYDHPAAEIRRRLDDNALQCILFNLPMGDASKGDFGLACRPGREAEFRKSVERTIEYAMVLGCPQVNCVAGKIQPGEDAARVRRTLVSNLRFAAPQFKAADVRLVVEPINDKDNPGFFMPRCPMAAEIIAEVGEDNLALQCDLYHTVMMGDDPVRILETLRPMIRHIQFADVPGRNEPGVGTIDYPKLFALIDNMGYAGWVSAEYGPSRNTLDSLGWFQQ